MLEMSGSELIEERKGWSECRVNSFKRAVESLDEITKHTDLCIYVTGSFGRLEASEYSDLDLFFIKENTQGHPQMSHIDKTLMDASLIHKCREMCFPPFSGDGEYLQVHSLRAMRENLGGRKDDYENLFTARLLLLLESLPIYNDSLYDEVLCKITHSYFRDYEDHEKDFRPTFLVNDILRFWKTLCLNYEHSRNIPDSASIELRKSYLKNIKLKFSRMLTCFSLVIPLAMPRDSLEPEECVQLMRKRPLERLQSVAESDYSEIWDKLTDEYGWFLEVTGRPREQVLDWIDSSENRVEALDRAKSFGNSMHELLVSVSKPETLRYLVI